MSKIRKRAVNPCIDCVTHGCPWEEDSLPVEGWVATKVKLPLKWSGATNNEVETYSIEHCPLFTPHPRRGEREETDNRGKRYTRPFEARNIKTGETKIYQNVKEAVADGFTAQQVRRVLTGVSSNHKGHVFAFVED